MRAAGPAIPMLTRNLSFMEQFWVRVAAMVVSEMKERLSPKKAPPTTMALTKAMACSLPGEISPARAAATGTRATMVPTLVPMAVEMKHDAIKRPA